jgi:hypothetical protein
VIRSKSDFDIQKREAFIIKETVSSKMKDVVEKFLTSCRIKLKDQVEESNIKIELKCGYIKGDEFEGFMA